VRKGKRLRRKKRRSLKHACVLLVLLTFYTFILFFQTSNMVKNRGFKKASLIPKDERRGQRIDT